MAQRRVLILSSRNLKRRIQYAGAYENEDLIREWEGADLLAPELAPTSPTFTRLSRRLERYTALSVAPTPRINGCKITRDYDLLYMHCMTLEEVEQLTKVAGWRERCRLAVCRLEELWAHEMALFPSYYRRMADLLRAMDLVLIGCKGSVAPTMALAGDHCFYSPGGVDAATFCPGPPGPARAIDVMGMGRRGERTHQAFLELAQQGRLFYLCDSMHGSLLIDHRLHRFNLASQIKRARYFVAYRGKVDMRKQTAAQEEIGFRFFEGAAGGAVMIGEAPAGEEFQRQFDWPDAVVSFPFDSAAVAPFLAALDGEPERMATIRRNNVVGSLRKHDWLYRWQDVLSRLALEASPGMKARKERLHQLAARVAES